VGIAATFKSQVFTLQSNVLGSFDPKKSPYFHLFIDARRQEINPLSTKPNMHQTYVKFDL